MSEKEHQILPVLPLGNGVLLPHMAVPVALETQEAKAAVKASRSTDATLLVVTRSKGQYAPVGTVAKIINEGRTAEGAHAVVVEGIHRAVIGAGVPGTGSALWVQYTPRPDPKETTPKVKALAKEYKAVVENIVDSRGMQQAGEIFKDINAPGALADAAGYAPDLSMAQRIELLETFDVESRLTKVLDWAKEILADISLKKKIKSEVTEDMSKTQREYLLRRQMDAIQKELGEISGEKTMVEEYRAKIAKAGLPEIAAKEAEKEIKRLERTPEQNPEHGWIRTYLDWLADIPWSKRTEDQLEIKKARQILDEDHTGLDDVKDRILEYLSVRKLRKERGMTQSKGRGAGAILTLVGPPGVGKTSLGESIARAMGRKFVRASLGGVRDEAEIRGHRRTYIGALPGRIARGLKDAGTINPVFMLDEIDKVGSDWRGDPSSALLEVLDPAQNNTFKDHFLEVPLDLSEVMFICTANIVDTIPGPLLDRMEVIHLEGYTQEEKVAIAKKHLIARQEKHNGLKPGEVRLATSALRRIVDEYTHEAGVRNLEREIGTIFRKAAARIATDESAAPLKVEGKDIPGYLGRQKVFHEVAERTRVPGVATGLSVTGAGGDVLFVEATRLESPKGPSSLTLTGQLGDVMKESVRIALSFVESHATDLSLDKSMTKGGHYHVHVPAGAIPKDGPSAGVTMVVALTSLMSGRPVRPTVGMTGEVTLRGRVLPVGGIKQKILAAHRAGLKEVILPQKNEGDLEKIPASVRKQMKFHLISDVLEAIPFALEKAKPKAKSKK